MAEPRPDNRTPVLGLKPGVETDHNFNWFKLDDTIGRAFEPGSPLQLPDVPASKLPPTITDSDETTVLAQKTLAAADQDVCHLAIGTTDGGPILVTGALFVRLQNVTASNPQALFTLTFDRPDVPGANFSWNFKVVLSPNQIVDRYPVPLLWFCQKTDLTPASNTDIFVRMRQDAASLSNITAQTQTDGYCQATELQKGGR